jgi:hypothetical protein
MAQIHRNQQWDKDDHHFLAFGPEIGTFLKNDIQLGFILGLNGSTEKEMMTKPLIFSVFRQPFM